ncbi:hypothetical protein VPNG_04534 [Cytospora leucostoma]|uniref:Uncharacterized protein n=1 Tax=Cytospora leucostoma TaxID=1230097 RepID=A0A423XCF5_9PEZI|nr:hypothetical protein VPNG_04534 [Cytospora leucostoma]
MVLLTSSQVSVALSSLIVISFTTALFLSGYVIQQRTVRNLRAAIKPNTSPQVYIPDEFRTDTSELADGTLVVLDEYNRPVRQKLGKNRQAPAKQNHGGGDGDDGHVVVEVKETTPDDVEEQQQQQQRALAIELLQQETENAENPIKARQPQPRAPLDAGPQKAPWEVRARAPRPDEEDQVENPDDETKKPVSRAERRRLIKEEIERLASGEQPIYYQRRLW